MTAASWALAFVAVAAGATVQGSVGFGMNLVAAPVLALIDPIFLPVPTLMTAFTLAALLAFRERRAIAFDELGWALAGRLPGSLVGVGVVLVVSRERLGTLLAVVVALGVVLSLAGVRVPVTRPSLIGAGVVSGVMGTATSVGGPPMALLYQHADGPALRGRLSSYFMVGTLLSLALLTIAGAVDGQQVLLGAALAPAVVAGFFASARLRGRLDAGRTRPAVLAVSALAAVALLVR